jgi:hypothetical protein
VRYTYSVSTLNIPAEYVATGLAMAEAIETAVAKAKSGNIGTAVHREGSGKLIAWFHAGTGTAARVLR